MRRIQLIVEGHGERTALPVLLRRLQQCAGAYDLGFGQPMRHPKAQILVPDKLETFVTVARVMEDAAAVLIVIDGDEQCPRTDYADLKRVAAAAAGPLPCEFVAAVCEYEAWFIASMESLRDVRRIALDATSHPNPETVRGAKEYLESFLPKNVAYAETTDQAAFSECFDLAATYARCRSFRQLVKAYRRTLAALELEPGPDWPFPSD